MKGDDDHYCIDYSPHFSPRRPRAFTQKTTTQLHQTMLAQTARLNATINTLRSRLLSSETQLSREIARSSTLRASMDELADGFERETFGRRRETGLRIKCIEREEKWAERGARWRDRVRRERGRLGVASLGGGYGMGSASASTASINSLMSPTSTNAGLPPLRTFAHDEQIAHLWELLESGLQLFSVDESPLADVEVRLEPSADQRDGVVSVDGQTSRRILAEEIFLSLIEDLQQETKRRVALEKERMTKVATAGLIDADEAVDDQDQGSSEMVAAPSLGFTTITSVAPGIDEHINSEPEDSEATPRMGDVAAMTSMSESAPGNTTSSSTVDVKDTTRLAMAEDPAVSLLKDQIGRVPERYATLQKALHDCAHSLTSLREESTGSSSNFDYDTASKQLAMLLDGIHDVIEDVRVEVEIAIADDERVGAGLQTLLTLNPDVKSLSTARAFIDGDGVLSDSNGRRKITGFKRRLADVEHDLVKIKVAVAAMQLEDDEVDVEAELDTGVAPPKRSDAFSGLQLRTVTAPNGLTSSVDDSNISSSGMTSPGNGMKRGFFGSLGRSLTGTTPNGSPSALHAPQRTASMGMFRSSSLSAGSVGILGGSSTMHSDLLPAARGVTHHRSLADDGDSEDDVE